MMKRIFFGLAAVCAAGLLLLSCNPLTAPLPSGAADGPVVQHVPYSGSFTYTVDPGSTVRDVFFVFTNPSLVQDIQTIPSVTTKAVTIDGVSLPAPGPQPLRAVNSAPATLAERISEFNRNPAASIAHFQRQGGFSGSLVSAQPAQNDVKDVSTATFVTDIDLNGNPTPTGTVSATCRYVSSLVDLGDGRKRSLSIWVDDTRWLGTDNPTSNMITPARVSALAQTFLQNPASLSDIYHWDTAAVGEPWGTHSNSQLIPWDAHDTITILLANLNAAYTGTVLVGYFWSKDNYQLANVPGSNQRIMFYMDSTLYGTIEPPETAWSATGYWPKIIYSTLAHEFQHMIHFYQKQVVQGTYPNGTDTWINEMCSMIMEDLVADKLGVEGPRGINNTDGTAGSPGITLGRLPDFTASSNYSVAGSFDPNLHLLADYSVAYAFGAWLARNYGGCDLLKRIVQCSQTDSAAVVNAVNAFTNRTESVGGLLEKWAAAALLSSLTSAPPGYRYNTGGWVSSGSATATYKLGSINLFNYVPPLKVFTGMPAGSLSYTSNTYYQAQVALGSTRTWSITVPQGVVMSVVLK